MPRTLQLSDLRTRALRRVNMETDLSVVTAEVNALLSAQCADLYMRVTGSGLRYFETSVTLTATGASYLPEPVNHLSTVDTIERIVDSSGRLRRLQQLMPQERWRWAGRTGPARRWELVDDRINLYPTPAAGDQYILRYVQQPPDLTTYADTDLVDVVNDYGLEFVIWGTGVKLLAKSRSDVTLAMKERDENGERLTEWAAMRAFNDPPRIIVEEDDDMDFYRDGDWRYDR